VSNYLNSDEHAGLDGELREVEWEQLAATRIGPAGWWLGVAGCGGACARGTAIASESVTLCSWATSSRHSAQVARCAR